MQKTSSGWDGTLRLHLLSLPGKPIFLQHVYAQQTQRSILHSYPASRSASPSLPVHRYYFPGQIISGKEKRRKYRPVKKVSPVAVKQNFHTVQTTGGKRR